MIEVYLRKFAQCLGIKINCYPQTLSNLRIIFYIYYHFTNDAGFGNVYYCLSGVQIGTLDTSVEKIRISEIEMWGSFDYGDIETCLVLNSR